MIEHLTIEEINEIYYSKEDFEGYDCPLCNHQVDWIYDKTEKVYRAFCCGKHFVARPILFEIEMND